MEIPSRFEVLGAAAAWGLPTDLPPPTTPLPSEDFTWLVRHATTERVLGPLAAAVGADAWPVTPTQREEISRLHRGWMSTALRIEHTLVAVSRALGDAGTTAIVLKGTAIAHLDEPDPSWRCFGDLDLLLPGAEIASVARRLVDAGGRRHFREPRPGFDQRFTKGMAITTTDQVEIDLHRTIAPGPYGLAIDLDELHAGTVPFALGGEGHRALGRPQRFLHAAYHGVLGSQTQRLLPLRDLARTAPRTAAELAVVLGTARSWRGLAPVAMAVRSAQERLGWTPPPDLAAWAAAFVPDRRERRWLASSAGADRSSAAQALLGVEAVRGLAPRAAYLHAVLLPADAASGAALRARGARGWGSISRSLGRPRP